MPLRQGDRGFEPHSGHLKVYLFAYGCVLSFVGTRLVTVPPRHPSKYLKPLKRGTSNCLEHQWTEAYGTQQTIRAGQRFLNVTLAVRQDSRGAACGTFCVNPLALEMDI